MSNCVEESSHDTVATDAVAALLDNASVLDDAEVTISFSPPLYRQRYRLVADLLQSHHVTSVVDFGCAECKSLLVYRDVTDLHRIIGVDIDRQILANSIPRITPLISDYVFRRSFPLCIELYHGSLGDLDSRVSNVDAVTLIEVIEHLDSEILSKMPETVFGFIAPRIVILTTPNVEFNVLFPNLTGFRHADHKFEWTRLQFQQWCNVEAATWGYSVEFDGVGAPPDDVGDIGCCSQVAIFKRLSGSSSSVSTAEESSRPYELVHSVNYPVKAQMGAEETALCEAQYYVNFMAHGRDAAAAAAAAYDGDDADDDGDEIVDNDDQLISLEKLLEFPRLQNAGVRTIDHLRQLLAGVGYVFSNDGRFVVYHHDRRRDIDDRDNYDDDDDVANMDALVSESHDAGTEAAQEMESWD